MGSWQSYIGKELCFFISIYQRIDYESHLNSFQSGLCNQQPYLGNCFIHESTLGFMKLHLHHANPPQSRQCTKSALAWLKCPPTIQVQSLTF